MVLPLFLLLLKFYRTFPSCKVTVRYNTDISRVGSMVGGEPGCGSWLAEDDGGAILLIRRTLADGVPSGTTTVQAIPLRLAALSGSPEIRYV